ncbi:hypothetical protein KP509_26G019900 [Ceratopteris richardii]|uniref:Glycosyltransferase 61 catalytic domain-containing protein n=1 Tax=Ceratopteris richardii TaxID=49495 RepID=A0A8T2RIY6_CERRI|nr:hypothetical protein KP509_26G019900 [Ceratopteris richardii]
MSQLRHPCGFSIVCGVLLIILEVVLYHSHRTVFELGHARGATSPLWTQTSWLPHYSAAAGRYLGLEKQIPIRQDTVSRYSLRQYEHLNKISEGLEDLLRTVMALREEIGRFRQNLSNLEAKVQMSISKDSGMDGLDDRLLTLARESEQRKQQKNALSENNMQEETRLSERSEEEQEQQDEPIESTSQGQSSSQEQELTFLPLMDNKLRGVDGGHVLDPFMSVIKGRGWIEGPPELFFFPGKYTNAEDKRLLCLRGNSTFDGARNFYALAYKEQLSNTMMVIPGVTLISETIWEYANPWHAMYNLLPFLFWRINDRCSQAHKLLLFNKGKYRTTASSWVTSLMKATGLPWKPSDINLVAREHSGSWSSSQIPTMCFEQAIVSRRGISTVLHSIRRRMSMEASCQARRTCNIHEKNSAADGEAAARMKYKRQLNVTLLMRSGGRSFRNEQEWEQVVAEECKASANCSWSSIHSDNLTFCEQVEVLSHTDILISSHGAQLVNMIFMPKGASVMEMFPGGWFELAGNGQYIYRTFANSLGLHHEGYWRDPSTPRCPNPSKPRPCFLHYKSAQIGINATHIANWLRNVIEKQQTSSLYFKEFLEYESVGDSETGKVCEC